MLKKYLPAIQRLGHDCTEVVENMVLRITYFPQRTENKECKYTPSITHQYSDTRPTKTQLSLYTTNEFNLTPMPPLLKLLVYTPKRPNTNHSVYPCPEYNCIVCRQYELTIQYKCPHYPLPEIPVHLYAIQEQRTPTQTPVRRYNKLTETNICNVGKFSRIRTHLNKRKSTVQLNQ